MSNWVVMLYLKYVLLGDLYDLLKPYELKTET